MASKTYTLQTSDNKTFVVGEDVICHFATIKSMLEDVDDVETIPLPNIKSDTLTNILAYIEHENNKTVDDEWREKIFNDENKTQMLELVCATNYLNYISLLNHACMIISKQIKHQTPQQIREAFNIENDFTPEEEEAIIREYEGFAFE